jgi:hypothetical protein
VCVQGTGERAGRANDRRTGEDPVIIWEGCGRGFHTCSCSLFIAMSRHCFAPGSAGRISMFGRRIPGNKSSRVQCADCGSGGG